MLPFLQTTIPKAVNSLKVLAELPIIVVLMYQVLKQNLMFQNMLVCYLYMWLICFNNVLVLGG